MFPQQCFLICQGLYTLFYTTKNATDLLQVVNSNKLQQTGQFDKVATSLLGPVYMIPARRDGTVAEIPPVV